MGPIIIKLCASYHDRISRDMTSFARKSLQVKNAFIHGGCSNLIRSMCAPTPCFDPV